MGLEETVLPRFEFRDPRKKSAGSGSDSVLFCAYKISKMNNNNDKSFRTGKNETINSPSQVKPQNDNAPAEPEFR
jgi:hypothetical protein